MILIYMTKFLLLLLLLIGGFLRFYNLNWGSPYYFHPDERNIATSVTQLKFPDQMNPHFFAYGSLPIYTIYFTGLLMNFFSHYTLLPTTYNLSFEQAILISRFYSALFSILLIPLLYILGNKLNGKKTGLIAAFLATTSVGFIQFAHFGTFEMWIAFFSVLLFYICLNLLHTAYFKQVFFAGLLLGILIATKISSLALLPLPFFSLFIHIFRKHFRHAQFVFTRSAILLLVSSLVFIITSPFALLDYSSFLSSIMYEKNVALGNLAVFYTGEFKNTIPVVFQFQKVYPFLLNPFIVIIFIPSFFYFLFRTFKTKSPTFFLLNSFFLILFLSQAFFYAKWIRYMIPTLPFMYLITGVAVSDWSSLLNKTSFRRKIYYYTNTIVVIFSILFCASYFITAFIKQDTRITASKWAKIHIPSDELILSEVYDLGILTFNPNFSHITLFNFYDLDNNSIDSNQQMLNEQLSQNNYLILPSQRILKTRLTNSRDYPQGHLFYQSLIDGNLGFEKIYETSCDMFCNITYLGNAVFSYEETANVFDRPIVFIFKRK